MKIVQTEEGNLDNLIVQSSLPLPVTLVVLVVDFLLLLRGHFRTWHN